MTFCAKMLNTDVQLAPSNTILFYYFFLFFKYAQGLMQEKTPATEKCMCCQSSFPCDDGQLDLEEASWPSKGQLGDGVQRLAD